MTVQKFRIAFLGTPEFSVPCLDLLAHHPLIDIVKVISMPDRPAGRGMELKSPEVIEYAKAHQLPYFQTANINHEMELIQELKSESIDFIIVLAFAQFLGNDILTLPKMGCFNIHTSLLPRYRGAAPIQYALLNGDQETGVSIQKMVKKMDAGSLVLSHKIPLSSYENFPLLYTRLKYQAALSLSDFISKVATQSLLYQDQDETLVSFAPTLKKEDGHLLFSQLSKKQVLNKIRALNPWPGTFCFLNTKRLKIFTAMPYHINLSPGDSRNDMGSLVVGCLDGSLRLSDIQLAGKKRCSDTELLNGIRSEIHLT